jgi:hypothetical protein
LKRISGEGEITFNQARTADSILKARERELKMAERRKELVNLDRVREHVSKAFISLRQVFQRLPIWRDNQDESGATIKMRRGGRVEG